MKQLTRIYMYIWIYTRSLRILLGYICRLIHRHLYRRGFVADVMELFEDVRMKGEEMVEMVD